MDESYKNFIKKQAQRNAVFDATEMLTRLFNINITRLLQQQISQGVEKDESVEMLMLRVKLVFKNANADELTIIESFCKDICSIEG